MSLPPGLLEVSDGPYRNGPRNVLWERTFRPEAEPGARFVWIRPSKHNREPHLRVRSVLGSPWPAPSSDATQRQLHRCQGDGSRHVQAGRKSHGCRTPTHLCAGYQIAAAARSFGKGRCQCPGRRGCRAPEGSGAGGSWVLWTRRRESGGLLSSDRNQGAWVLGRPGGRLGILVGSHAPLGSGVPRESGRSHSFGELPKRRQSGHDANSQFSSLPS